MPVPVLFAYLDIVASFAFLVWDWIIHLGDEVECIWWSKTNWMTWMYLFLRYFPIMVECSLVIISNANPPMSICTHWHIYQATCFVLLTFGVEVVLVVRIYALYNRKKAVIIPVLVVWLIEAAAMILSMIFAVPRMTFFGPCMIAYAPPCIMGYWMSATAFETILFILTLFRFFQFAPLHRKQGTLLHVFVRDGTWAYAVTFVVMLVNGLAVNAHVHTPLAGVCYQWAMAGFSCAGSHMLLNLRQYALRQNEHEHAHANDAEQFSSGVCFAQNAAAQGRSAFFTTEIEIYSHPALCIPEPVEIKFNVRDSNDGSEEAYRSVGGCNERT